MAFASYQGVGKSRKLAKFLKIGKMPPLATNQTAFTQFSIISINLGLVLLSSFGS